MAKLNSIAWGVTAALIPLVAIAVPLAARPAKPAVAADGRPVAILTAAFMAEIGTLPATASSEDLEAGLVFVVSQSEQPLPILLDALDRLEMSPGASPALKEAVRNVREALLCRRLRRGTASIGGAGLSAFSAPVGGGGGGGGGGSNYSR
jgi:hypothetical protein